MCVFFFFFFLFFFFFFDTRNHCIITNTSTYWGYKQMNKYHIHVIRSVNVVHVHVTYFIIGKEIRYKVFALVFLVQSIIQKD